MAVPGSGRIARSVIRRWSQRLRVDAPGWPALEAELDRWSPGTARFWWRDDDAADPAAPALARLLALREHVGVPIGLAVIPALAGEALPAVLAGSPRNDVTVLVHGWDHRNWAPPSEPKAELARGRDPAEVERQLVMARARIEALFPDRALPVLVPPFNGLAPELVPAVKRVGFRYISVDRDFPGLGFSSRNIHADVIDWSRMTANSPVALVRGLLAALRLRRAGLLARWMPMGVLTHHLAQDDVTWDMTLALLERLSRHAAVAFPPLEEIFAG